MDVRADSMVAARTETRADGRLPRVAEHLEKLLPDEYQADTFFFRLASHGTGGAVTSSPRRRFMRVGPYLDLRSEPPRLCLHWDTCDNV
jgi:hypothetical protein